MKKRFLTVLTIVITMLYSSISVMAANNYLNAVVMEKQDDSYNIILRSDAQAKVKKTIIEPDKITLTLKGISSASNLSTLYKNTSDVHGLVVENSANNEVKIYLQAPGISKASVVFETPDSTPIPVKLDSESNKTVFAFLLLAIAIIAIKSTKVINRYDNISGINRSIREREVQMYKNFKIKTVQMSNMKQRPSINNNINSFGRKYSSDSIRRAGKKETLRNYESLTRLN